MKTGVLTVVVVGLFALLVLPLRVVKERGYVSDEVALGNGTLKVAVDGTYYPLPVPFWHDGVQTNAPFRLRIFYRPFDSALHHVAVTRAEITVNGIPHQLVVRPDAGSWHRDDEGASVYIVGFLNVPLNSSDAVAELELLLDGRSNSTTLRVSISSNIKVVHSGLEALMGI